MQVHMCVPAIRWFEVGIAKQKRNSTLVERWNRMQPSSSYFARIKLQFSMIFGNYRFLKKSIPQKRGETHSTWIKCTSCTVIILHEDAGNATIPGAIGHLAWIVERSRDNAQTSADVGGGNALYFQRRALLKQNKKQNRG